MSNYYDILGIDPNASPAEIRRCYRELARRLHPDVSPTPMTSHQEFIRVTEAYHVLADPVRRADYDHEVGVRGQGSRVSAEDTETRGHGDAEMSEPRVPTVAPPPKGDPRVPASPRPCLTPDPWLLTPGAQRLRVDVDFGGTVLVCRLRAFGNSNRDEQDEQDGMDGPPPTGHPVDPVHPCELSGPLTLAAPQGARRAGPVREGARVKLTLYRPEGCFEAEASVREWIWSRPPLLVTGPVEQWRPGPRRRSRRLPREVEARLELESMGEFAARTTNVSASGVLLLLRGCPNVWEGAAGRLSLQIGPDLGCGPLPCHVARVLHWLRPSGRSVEVGLHLLPCDEEQRLRWEQCLGRLGVGSDEVMR